MSGAGAGAPLFGDNRDAGVFSTACTGSNTFVVPIYSQIDATGTAALSVVHAEAVCMNYDLSFNITLSDVSSGMILNGFVLSQDGINDTDGTPGLSVAMRTGANLLAKSGTWQGDFRLALAEVIEDAVDAKGETLAWNLYDSALGYFKDVYGDAVANVLESDWALTITVDASGGATNMWNDLSVKPDAMLLIAEQIPNSTYMAYVDASENMMTDALPLLNGDTLVFLFNVAMKTIARNIRNVQAQASMANARAPSGWNGASYGANGQSTATDASGGPVADLSGDVSGNRVADLLNVGGTPSFSYTSQIAAFYVTMSGAYANPANSASAGLVGSLVAVDAANAGSEVLVGGHGVASITKMYKLAQTQEGTADLDGGADVQTGPNAA